MTNAPHLRGYTFRLYPSPQLAERLHEQRKMMADLWNALKQRIEDTYRRERRMLSFFDLTTEITGLRHECPEWREVPAITAHRVAKQLTVSYAAFFRRLKNGDGPAGYPRWKARERADAIPLGTMATTGWRLVQRDAKSAYAWCLHYGSLTDARDRSTWIGARGILPFAPADWRNGAILWRDRRWWLSIAVERPSRPSPPSGVGVPLTLEFGLLDRFCLVDGTPTTPLDLDRAIAIEAEIDEGKATRDRRWPPGAARRSEEYREESARIARRAAYAARVRRNALHVWSARIVAGASAIAIVTPSPRDDYPTARGDRRNPGAEVATVAALNRRQRQYAVAAAVQMLKYKAAAKDIRCEVTVRRDPLARDLAASGREARRLRRATKRLAEAHA